MAPFFKAKFAEDKGHHSTGSSPAAARGPSPPAGRGEPSLKPDQTDVSWFEAQDPTAGGGGGRERG